MYMEYGVHCTVVKNTLKLPLRQAESPALAVPRFSPAYSMGSNDGFDKTGAEKTRGLDPFYPSPHVLFYLLHPSFFQARRILTPHLIVHCTLYSVHFISCLSRSRLRTAKRVCGTPSIKGGVND